MLLNEELQECLVQIIREDFGRNLGHAAFIGICFDLFDDIAGCDTANESERTSIIHILWSKYHDRNRCK